MSSELLLEGIERQDALPDFSTRELQDATIRLIGAGGIGSAIAIPLVRKGAGTLHICDGDVVELSNLNRQAFFLDDLFKSKAICLARNAAAHGYLPSEVTGDFVEFTADNAEELIDGADVVCVGVDNDRCRAFTSQFCRSKQVPVIHAAVNRGADFGWIFVEEPTGPCVGCVFPRICQALNEPRRCISSPAVTDILQAISGHILFGIDSILMQRARHWNYREVHLRGGTCDLVTTTHVRKDCTLCGGERRNAELKIYGPANR